MKLSPFWLNLFKEARDAATLQLAKDVVNAYTAEAEAYTLYKEDVMEQKTKEQVAWTDIAKPKQGRILLMPYHLSDEQKGECLHLVSVPGTAVMVVCHNWTEENCGCCEKPTCEQHFSEREITLEYERSYGTYPLCLECSKLPRVHIEAIFKLQNDLNEP